MKSATTIHWFRQDLRLGDNPGLFEAARLGCVLPVYILDEVNGGEHAMGSASRWWLHHSLHALNEELDGRLQVFRGDPLDIIPRLAKSHSVQRVHWNRCYEPWRMQRDRRLKELLKDAAVEVRSFNSALLWEPWEVLKQDGEPYKVFTPYYKNGCLQAEPPRRPLLRPREIFPAEAEPPPETIDGLGLLPRIRWDASLEPHWEIGEHGAHRCLHEFLEHGLSGYREKRDYPSLKNVSRLSPHLHFGEISPHQVWHAAGCTGFKEDAEHFRRELAWREFSHYLLHHFPGLPRDNFVRKFDRFPWNRDPALLQRWQQGRTGIPIVDAGMRELWQTGWMHNRVRMITASFLTKNLLLHWHHGHAWFADCLVDADLANNSASWQWVAGCGADAAPYFRIFNPVTQGQKFDPQGEYTRRYVPELKKMPDKYLFNPWEAPAQVLRQAGVRLGESYPLPVVDLKQSRERALAAYQEIR